MYIFHFVIFQYKLCGTSPKFTANLSNIMEHLSLVLKMKLPEKILAFEA